MGEWVCGFFSNLQNSLLLIRGLETWEWIIQNTEWLQFTWWETIDIWLPFLSISISYFTDVIKPKYTLHHYTFNMFNLRLMEMLRGMLSVIDPNTLQYMCVIDVYLFLRQRACWEFTGFLALVSHGNSDVIHSHLNMTSGGRQRKQRVAQQPERLI